MDASWKSYNRRAAVLREMLDIADARRDGVLPWDETPGAAEAFETPAAVLQALAVRWRTTLLARLDSTLEDGADDPREACLAVVAALATERPGLVAILEAHAADPAVAAARARVARQVSLVAGSDLREELARPSLLTGPRRIGRAAQPDCRLLDRLARALG